MNGEIIYVNLNAESIEDVCNNIGDKNTIKQFFDSHINAEIFCNKLANANKIYKVHRIFSCKTNHRMGWIIEFF